MHANSIQTIRFMTQVLQADKLAALAAAIGLAACFCGCEADKDGPRSTAAAKASLANEAFADIRVVGNGVDRTVKLAPGESIRLSELLRQLEPLPAQAVGLDVKHPGDPPSLTRFSLSDAKAGPGASHPIFAGDVVVFLRYYREE